MNADRAAEPCTPAHLEAVAGRELTLSSQHSGDMLRRLPVRVQFCNKLHAEHLCRLSCWLQRILLFMLRLRFHRWMRVLSSGRCDAGAAVDLKLVWQCAMVAECRQFWRWIVICDRKKRGTERDTLQCARRAGLGQR